MRRLCVSDALRRSVPSCFRSSMSNTPRIRSTDESVTSPLWFRNRCNVERPTLASAARCCCVRPRSLRRSRAVRTIISQLRRMFRSIVFPSDLLVVSSRTCCRTLDSRIHSCRRPQAGASGPKRRVGAPHCSSQTTSPRGPDASVQCRSTSVDWCLVISSVPTPFDESVDIRSAQRCRKTDQAGILTSCTRAQSFLNVRRCFPTKCRRESAGRACRYPFRAGASDARE